MKLRPPSPPMSRIQEPEYNLILDSDSYKVTHYLQMPDDAEEMMLYLECRGGKYPYMVSDGFVRLIHKYLYTRITYKMIDEAEAYITQHFGTSKLFNREGWEYIVEKYDGCLPVMIYAPREGDVLPIKNAFAVIKCNDKKVFWVAGYLETLLVRIWSTITTATKSFDVKLNLFNRSKLCSSVSPYDAFGNLYGGIGLINPLLYKLHDFGARGGSSYETSSICGASHLLNFLGTDTMTAMQQANAYKFGNMSLLGHSIPASEHSTMTIYGPSGEVVQFARMIDKFGDMPVFACVSDGFNIYDAIRLKWGAELAQRVRDMNAILVVRPDSGHPVNIVTECIELLDKAFGHTTFEQAGKTWKILNHVRLIQGDGISEVELDAIMDNLMADGWSIDNIAFGMGGGLIQKQTRDTMKIACKNVFMICGGKEICIQKDPITDPGKKSKRGRVFSVWDPETGVKTLEEMTDEEFNMVSNGSPLDHMLPLLTLAYDHGFMPESYHRTLPQARVALEKHLQSIADHGHIDYSQYDH